MIDLQYERLIQIKRRRAMLRSIGYVAFGLMCGCATAGVIWCGGFNFDRRSAELAMSIIVSFAAAILGPLALSMFIKSE